MEQILKQVIVVRTDLNMGKGKIAGQVAHASVTAAYECLTHNPELFKKWYYTHQSKIVVKVNSQEELINLYKSACDINLPASLIKDAGRTQLHEPAYTAVGIGPYNDTIVDTLTKELKLL